MSREVVLVLSKILNLYEEMLDLSKKKRTVLMEARMDRLEQIVQKEQSLIAVVEKLEKEREAILAGLLAAGKIASPSRKLTDLIALCDEATGASLKEIHRGLEQTLSELKAQNESNNRAIRQALSLVNYNLNVLSGASVAPVYAGEGREVVTHRSRFDFKT